MTSRRDFNMIGEWLRPLLQAGGMSVEQFSNKVGVSRSAVYHYIKDSHRPTEETMAVMCKVLGRPYSEGLSQYTPRKPGRPSHEAPRVFVKRR